MSSWQNEANEKQQHKHKRENIDVSNSTIAYCLYFGITFPLLDLFVDLLFLRSYTTNIENVTSMHSSNCVWLAFHTTEYYLTIHKVSWQYRDTDLTYTPGKNQCSSVLLSNEHILWQVGTYSEKSRSFLSFCIIKFYFSSIHYRVQWRHPHVQIFTESLSSKLVFEIFHYYKIIFWGK